MEANNALHIIKKIILFMVIGVLAAIFISLGAMVGTVLGYWRTLPSLERLEYQESEKWKFHLEVYSDISTLEVTDTKEYLMDKLTRLEYVQVATQKPRKGEYSLYRSEKTNTDYIRIYTRDFRYPRLKNKGYEVTLRFQNNRIASIETADGAHISRFSLEPELIAELYSAEGTARELVYLPDIPKSLINAFIAIEDKRFDKHWGIDFYRALAVLYKDVLTWSRAEGFSTITMQLARNLFLTRERTLRRKMKEILLAIQIERCFSKDEILEHYLNFIDLGRYGHRQLYGVQQAAINYFGKPVWDLELHECALLAAIPKSPTYYSPLKHSANAKKRQNLILGVMLRDGYITQEQYNVSVKTPVEVLPPSKKSGTEAPHFVEYVKSQLESKYQSELLYGGGLKVYTTIDMSMQTMANSAIAEGLRELDKELGYPDYDANDPKSLNGIDPLSYIQGALIAIDPKTGYIKAMVGGRDFYISRNKLNYFNRAVQAKRQPGSAFKPFVYCAMFANPPKGNPATIIQDEAWGIDMPHGQRWRPQNYKKRYYGAVTARTALTKSLNVATARFMNEEKEGILRTISMAKAMGITSLLRALPSLALGSSEVTLLEITSAYGVWAAQGMRAEPLIICYVESRNGDILEENIPQRRQALDENIAYQMTYLLEGVFERGGTAQRARWAPLDFYSPAAGKTGTTNDYTDAWFIGYVPDFATGVWVGFDDAAISTEHTGAHNALPIWVKFMKHAAYHAVKDFPPAPSKIIFLDIDKNTGMLKNNNCPPEDIVREAFIIGNQPTVLCTEHP